MFLSLTCVKWQKRLCEVLFFIELRQDVLQFGKLYEIHNNTTQSQITLNTPLLFIHW